MEILWISILVIIFIVTIYSIVHEIEKHRKNIIVDDIKREKDTIIYNIISKSCGLECPEKFSRYLSTYASRWFASDGVDVYCVEHDSLDKHETSSIRVVSNELKKEYLTKSAAQCLNIYTKIYVKNSLHKNWKAQRNNNDTVQNTNGAHKMKLYEISNNYREVEDFDIDTSNEEDVLAFDTMLNNIKDKFKEKIESIAKIITSLNSKADACKNEIDRLSKNKKSFETKALRLRSYIQEEMNRINIEKIESDLFKFSIQLSNARVVVDNEQAINDEYFIINKVINKIMIRDDIKNGVIIEGVHLEQSKSLRIL